MSTELEPAEVDTWQAGGLVASILILTGVAGLIYEVAWQRYLGVLLGIDHAASAVTLAVFLGGLSLGYALCGNLSARTASPLRVYAFLELTIGLWGLLFPWIFEGVQSVSRGWDMSSLPTLIAGSLGVALPLILLPAVLMGATVPLLTRGLAVMRSRLTATHARVYGLNTLGAVVGALGGAFALLPWFGPHHTVRLAALLNLAVAVALWAHGLTQASNTGAPLGDAHASRETDTPATLSSSGMAARRDRNSSPPQVFHSPSPSSPAPWALAVIALLSGVATMSQENALMRLLGISLGGTTFIFALVVAAFVISIAVGSLVVAKMREIPRAAICWSCLASSAAWLLLFTTYDAWPWAAHALRFALAHDGLGMVPYYALVFTVLSLILLPAVAPLGAVLPLVFHERGATLPESGRVAGRLLAWSALGALVGSIGGGLWLYTVLDHGRVLLVAPLLAATMACLAARTAGRAARVAAPALGVLAAAWMIWLPGFDSERLLFSTYRLRETTPTTFAGPGAFHDMLMLNKNVVYHSDGPLDSVAVVESPAWDLPMPRPLEIYINGKSDSNTLKDRETLRLSAHLPMLLAPQTRRALVIGQGTGVSLGELTSWPELEQIDLVEVSTNVLDTLPMFAPQTYAVHKDPRVELHAQDARLFLRDDANSWDVIVSEPSNLWVGHNDLLFTESFFRAVAARLTKGGLLLQWVHLYETDADAVCSVVATLRAVFPELVAFQGTQGDWLLVASLEPLAGMKDRAQARWDAQEAVRTSTRELDIHSFEELWSRKAEGFANYAEESRKRCKIHTELDMRLNRLATAAMFSGKAVSPTELLNNKPNRIELQPRPTEPKP